MFIDVDDDKVYVVRVTASNHFVLGDSDKMKRHEALAAVRDMRWMESDCVVEMVKVEEIS